MTLLKIEIPKEILKGKISQVQTLKHRSIQDTCVNESIV